MHVCCCWCVFNGSYLPKLLKKSIIGINPLPRRRRSWLRCTSKVCVIQFVHLPNNCCISNTYIHAHTLIHIHTYTPYLVRISYHSQPVVEDHYSVYYLSCSSVQACLSWEAFSNETMLVLISCGLSSIKDSYRINVFCVSCQLCEISTSNKAIRWAS